MGRPGPAPAAPLGRHPTHAPDRGAPSGNMRAEMHFLQIGPLSWPTSRQRGPGAKNTGNVGKCIEGIPDTSEATGVLSKVRPCFRKPWASNHGFSKARAHFRKHPRRVGSVRNAFDALPHIPSCFSKSCCSNGSRPVKSEKNLIPPERPRHTPNVLRKGPFARSGELIHPKRGARGCYIPLPGTAAYLLAR